MTFRIAARLKGLLNRRGHATRTTPRGCTLGRAGFDHRERLVTKVFYSTMRTKSRHIALFGHFGSDNLGNEASFKAMLDLIRRARPDAAVTCICYGVETVRAKHRVSAMPVNLPFPHNRWFRLFNRLLLGAPFRLLDITRALHL